MRRFAYVSILIALLLSGTAFYYFGHVNDTGSKPVIDIEEPSSTPLQTPVKSPSPQQVEESPRELVSPTPENLHNENTNNNSDQDNDNEDNENNSPKNVIIEKEGLVELIKLDDSFVLDIKYATNDNFTKKKIYTMPMCLIHKDTAKKLINANNEFKTLGYRIKIYDAYRPYSAQQVLWDAAEDKSFVASPKKGSIHNRGAAVDITLVDENGEELLMPSGYDEFTRRARLDYNECEQELIDNRELLGRILIKHGFKRISNEWWHFEDTNAKKYPILDIAFEEFLKEN